MTPYPPGILASAPGEFYTELMINYLEELVAHYGYVEGAADPSLGRLRVVGSSRSVG